MSRFAETLPEGEADGACASQNGFIPFVNRSYDKYGYPYTATVYGVLENMYVLVPARAHAAEGDVKLPLISEPPACKASPEYYIRGRLAARRH